ncbi:hypothetical protein PLICRDRAFT_281912 [Plicaturopsis crispa FD-325 SS-3]|nr:hypothetical protein PLICRDRAFT_281912 [Plicaturopsis crispa FD-325 SS-3]
MISWRRRLGEIRPHGLAPRLSAISYEVQSALGVTLGGLFISASLRELEIFHPTYDEGVDVEYGDIYDCVARIAPKLNTLSIEFEDPLTPDSQLKCLNMMALMKDLAFLKVDVTLLSAGLAGGMLQMHKLEKLHIMMYLEEEGDLQHPPDLSAGQTAFPRLQHLLLDGDYEDLIRFFRGFPRLPLAAVTIKTRGMYTTNDAANLMAGIRAIAYKTVLRELQVNTFNDDEALASWDERARDMQNEFTLDCSVISPAFDFTQLTLFSVEFGVPLYLTDADLRRVARAWPLATAIHLSSIVYRAVGTPPTIPAATLASLIHFRHCPNLEELGVVVDVRTSETNAEYERLVAEVTKTDELVNESFLPKLKWLAVGPSWIGPSDLYNTAEVLYCLCGNLISARPILHGEHNLFSTAWWWSRVTLLYQRISVGPPDDLRYAVDSPGLSPNPADEAGEICDFREHLKGLAKISIACYSPQMYQLVESTTTVPRGYASDIARYLFEEQTPLS